MDDLSENNSASSGLINRDRAIITVAHLALEQFTSELREYRILMETAMKRDGKEPRHLVELGNKIGGKNKQLAREKATKLRDLYQSEIREIFSVQADPDNGSSKQSYPMRKEQLVIDILISNPKLIEKQFEIIKDIEDPRITSYISKYTTFLNKENLPSSILGKALLPSLTRSVEDLLGSLIDLLLILHPKALGGTFNIEEQNKFSLSEMYNYQTREDLKRLAISEQVGRFLKKGLLKWEKILFQNQKIAMKELVEDWGEVVEAFARRNAVVHSNGLVDQGYLAQTKEIKLRDLKIGDFLNCDWVYTCNILNVIEHLGENLVIAFLAKLLPKSTDLVDFSFNFVIKSLKESRWNDVCRIGKLVLDKYPSDHSHYELKVNLWMAQRELGQNWEVLKKEIQEWQPPDELRYRLAKAALLLDETATISALKAYKRQENSLAWNSLIEWPLIINIGDKFSAIKKLLQQKR